jgi:hypothetical protein
MVMAKKRCGLTAFLMASLAVMSNGADTETEDEYHHTHDHNVLTEKHAFCDGVFKLESFEYSCGNGQDCSWGSTVDFNVTCK